MIVNRFSDRSNQELLNELCASGTKVPDGLPEEIIARGESIVDGLGEALLDEHNRDDDATNEMHWMRNHTFMLLGLIGSPKAAPYILDYFRLDLDWDDMLTEDGDNVLGRLGPEAIDAIMEYADEEDRDTILQGVAMEGLVNVGFSHPEVRERIVQYFRQSLASSQDEERITSIVDSAIYIDDPELQKDVDRAFDTGQVDPFVIDKEYVEEFHTRYTPWKTERGDFDLMYYFSREFFDKCELQEKKNRERRKKYEASRLNRIAPNEPSETYYRPTPKIGRNEPCPCGSGKKYKKCCGSNKKDPF